MTFGVLHDAGVILIAFGIIFYLVLLGDCLSQGKKLQFIVILPFIVVERLNAMREQDCFIQSNFVALYLWGSVIILTVSI